MGQAYSAGLTVTDNIILRKERILPLKGQVVITWKSDTFQSG